ncbi:MAG: hypothetical protein B7X41_13225 [Microbacterium sp. 14-71-5]|nr:MAG: hypothetical protein B7X41_13225 [Microbacterium sp. 14-71-5]
MLALQKEHLQVRHEAKHFSELRGAQRHLVDAWLPSVDGHPWVGVPRALNRPGVSGDSSSWRGWDRGHVEWCVQEVPA